MSSIHDFTRADRPNRVMTRPLIARVPELPASPGRRGMLGFMGAMTLGAALPWLVLPREADAAPTIGQAAPAFSVVDSRGERRTLDALKGRIVVLEWTNHECPYVRKHYGADNMQALQREATAAGVVWLSVITSPPGEQGYVTAAEADALTARRNAAPTAVVFDPDGTMGRAYRAQTTPHMYVIAADGRLAYMGGIDSIASARASDIEKATPLLRNALQDVRAGRAVATPVTRPYGCTVKYSPA